MSLEVVSVLADRDLKHLCDLFLLLSVGFDTVGENDAVHRDLDLFTEDRIECLHDVTIVLWEGIRVTVPEESDTDL